MKAFDRIRCLLAFKVAGIDLLTLNYPNNEYREGFIETCWNVIQEGIGLEDPPHVTVEKLRDEILEIQEIGPDRYAHKYGLEIKE